MFLDKNSNFKVRRRHAEQLMSYFYKFRFALRPCLIISSNKLVHQFLNEKSDQSYNGLRDFVYSLFGQNILFSDPEDRAVQSLQKILHKFGDYLKHFVIVRKHHIFILS
jgi:hypothetical protein